MESMLQITLLGRKPVIFHNGRLSNPLDPYTRKLKTLTKKRNKTDEDLVAIMSIEARAGCYETPDGLLGVQASAVFRSIVDSAKLDKLGKLVTQALSFDDCIRPILIDGKEISCDAFLAMERAVDYRSVKIGTSRTMRARPIVHPDWEVMHSFHLDRAILDLELLSPVIERAGLRFGIGDWRPVYGTFDTVVEVV